VLHQALTSARSPLSWSESSSVALVAVDALDVSSSLLMEILNV
jgi:hypothetical protein